MRKLLGTILLPITIPIALLAWLAVHAYLAWERRWSVWHGPVLSAEPRHSPEPMGISESRARHGRDTPAAVILGCPKCHFAEFITTQQAGAFLRLGWPKHCGQTMQCDHTQEINEK